MSPSFIDAFRQHLLPMGSDPLTDPHSPIISQITVSDDRHLHIHAGTISFTRIDDPEKDRLLDEIISAAQGITAVEPKNTEQDLEDEAPISLQEAHSEADTTPHRGLDPTYHIASLDPEIVDQLIIALLRDYYDAQGAAGLKISSAFV